MNVRQQLRDLLSENKLEEVFDLMEREGWNSDVLALLKARWSALRKHELHGTMASDDLQVGYAQLRQQLLNLIQDEQKGAGPSRSSNAGKANYGRIVLTALLLLVGAFVVYRFAVRPDHREEPTQVATKKAEPNITAPGKAEPNKTTPSKTTPTSAKIEKKESNKPAEARQEKENPEPEKKTETSTRSVKRYEGSRTMMFESPSRNVTYEVLSAQATPTSGNQQIVKVKIRCTNHLEPTLMFWKSSFRMVIPGSRRPYSPGNDPNLKVSKGESATAEFVFKVPSSDAYELLVQVFNTEQSVGLIFS